MANPPDDSSLVQGDGPPNVPPFNGPQGTLFCRESDGNVSIFGLNGTAATVPAADLQAYMEMVVLQVLEEFGLSTTPESAVPCPKKRDEDPTS